MGNNEDIRYIYTSSDLAPAYVAFCWPPDGSWIIILITLIILYKVNLVLNLSHYPNPAVIWLKSYLDLNFYKACFGEENPTEKSCYLYKCLRLLASCFYCICALGWFELLILICLEKISRFGLAIRKIYWNNIGNCGTKQLCSAAKVCPLGGGSDLNRQNPSKLMNLFCRWSISYDKGLKRISVLLSTKYFGAQHVRQRITEIPITV